MFRKVSLIGLVLAAVVEIGSAQQTFTNDVYMLNYYSNRNNAAGADAFVRIVNPGTQGTPLQPATEGAICADIYVFDATQEMVECCSCRITANGVLQLSLINDLTQNPLTGFPAPNSGVIKVVSDDRANCNETHPVPVKRLLGWATHLQQPVSGTFVTTEDHFQDAPLGSGGGSQQSELDFLGQTCSFVHYLGSGKGICQCGSVS